MGKNINAQEVDLRDYQWENRVLLIVSETEDSEIYLKQKQEFEDAYSEMSERKLVVFEILKDKYRSLDYLKGEKKNWIFSKKPYEKYSFKNDKTLRLILIGMDGGTKVSQDEILTKAALFEKIDSMPMRRAELNRKKN